jgi:integrase
MRLKRWMADIAVIDEFGCPVKVTPHQFRHTYVICTASEGMRYVGSAA